jgi:ankyrin repeat protein
VVKLLLENDGVDLNFKDTDGRTPLLYAVARGHEAVVQLLLKKGADVESKSRSGRTLSWAAAMRHNAMVALLQGSQG